MQLRVRVLGSAVFALVLVPISFGVQPAAHATRAQPTTSIDWPDYLDGQTHTSYNSAATAITPANAATLSHAWTWTPPAPTQTGQPKGLLASPTVVNGVVYIGANTGTFFALEEATGKVLWSQNLGYVTKTTCTALGIVATATVEAAPGGGALTVYVSGGDGYLYALDAATGAVDWKSVIGIPSTTVNDYADWSSPTVVNGNIYIGVASSCDSPLVTGGLKEYNQANGALENTYQPQPGQKIQASIWSSAALDSADQNVFVTTGNGPGGDSTSVVRLDASTLAREDASQVVAPRGSDYDFGGSPTLFSASLALGSTPMVGACNKNGTYYAWQQGALAGGPVWDKLVGTPYTTGPQCDAAAVWDGSHLYIAGNGTTIGGTAYAGSIRMVDPATGAYLWETGLAGSPIGSPSMDGGGVIAVTEYDNGSAGDTDQVVLVNAATGAVLTTINSGPEFGQATFADNMLFVPTKGRGLIVYSAGTGATASFSYSCNMLVCSFDGTSSSAPGGVTNYAWDFGDTTTGSGPTVQHTFSGPGTYTVALTITGGTGLVASASQPVTVSDTAPQIAFVAASYATANHPTEKVTIPATVASGDAMVLVATAAHDQSITAPAGWSLVATKAAGTAMVTSVWSRVATATDAGSTVTVTFGTTNRHGAVQLLAYSGTSMPSPVAASALGAGNTSATSATTPTVSVITAGSWVMSGWAAKSSAVTSWTAPTGQVLRNADYGSGSGRIDMIATDGGGPAATGTAGGITASTDQPFSADTTLTLVLAPAP